MFVNPKFQNPAISAYSMINNNMSPYNKPSVSRRPPNRSQSLFGGAHHRSAEQQLTVNRNDRHVVHHVIVDEMADARK